MTRRLAVALFAFTLAVLLVSVLPLGLATSRRDRLDYAEGTRQLARSLATLSEEPFDERRVVLSSTRLAAAAGDGVSVVVTDLTGRVVAEAGPALTAPRDLVARAASGGVASVSRYDDYLAAAPVAPDNHIRGVVIVARPDEPVEARIARLWLILGVIAGTALALSVGLAYGAARWVARPLATLKTTASRWADGRLGQRANDAAGPPEVREVAHALNAMAGRLDALVDGSRAVVADVSHQLRTPLSAMRLRLELLRADADGKTEDDLAAALAEVDRLSRLVDGLLEVARAENVDVAPEPVDVGRLAEERRLAWQPVADERMVTITVDTSGRRVVASSTPGHLEQVLDNVLDNALEAVDAGGHVELQVSAHADRVVLRVSDDGRGMSEEQQQRAFHRFVSGGGERGTGLGLAIVHRLVTADGGTVHLDSTPGHGTVVVIDLPAVRGRAAAQT